MKTVLIHGQNHLGSSCRVGRLVASKLACAVAVGKAKARVGLKTRFLFSLMRLNNRNPDNANGPMRADYFYWKANGWLGKARPY